MFLNPRVSIYLSIYPMKRTECAYHSHNSFSPHTRKTPSAPMSFHGNVPRFLSNPLGFEHDEHRPSDEEIEAYVRDVYQPFASSLVYRPDNKYKGLTRCLARIYAYCLAHQSSFPMACWIDGFQLYLIKPLIMAFNNVWADGQMFKNINSNMKTHKFFTCMSLPNEFSDLMAVYHPPYRFFEETHKVIPERFPLPDPELHAAQHYRPRGRNRPCGCHELRLQSGYYWDSMIPLLSNITCVVSNVDVEFVQLRECE